MNQATRIQQLFAHALEMPPVDRDHFLDQACNGEPELHQQLSNLLRAHDLAGDFRRSNNPGPSADSQPPSSSFPDAIPKTVVLPQTTFCSNLDHPPAYGDYELLEEIARGGMGVVYKARQKSLNRLVALKMILAGQLASDLDVKRFHTEAEAAANLSHPNIVGIYEVGCLNGQHFFSMQFVEGRSLSQLQADGSWRTDRGRAAAELVAKVARAVHYAHAHGILHRDLKPGNVLIDANGEPHVLDFGLARRIGADSSLTLEGSVVGTPGFMAPEQAAGKNRELGIPSDIYSLGAILYFLLTGRPPFVAASALDTLVQVLEGEVIPPRLITPNVARDLERICLRCLEKSPAQRYPSAAALADDLDRFLRDETVQARPPGLRAFLRHWIRHQPALVSRLAGLAICLLIAQLTYLYYPSVTPARHLRIMSVLGIWALLSTLCQWALEKERWNNLVPYLWATADVACLTAFLWLDDALRGPLIASFVVLIATSGLWFRVPVVGLTTVLAIVGYGLLLGAEFNQAHHLEQVNWHIAFLVLLSLTAGAVAYQVHRVKALSRFYRRRP
jgi:eukaryotic-like serine/threonine-protein kinase